MFLIHEGDTRSDISQNMLDEGESEDGALSWQERSLCAQTDPDAFFPEKGCSTREAKKVCVGTAPPPAC